MSIKKHNVLAEGQYVLTDDVVNPNSDRRYKRQIEFMPVWLTGMKFDVRINTFDHGETHVEYNSVSATGFYGYVHSSNEGFNALVAKLVPVDRTVESVGYRAEKNYIGAKGLLVTLAEVHGWDLDKLDALVDSAIQLDEEEEAKKEAAA